MEGYLKLSAIHVFFLSSDFYSDENNLFPNFTCSCTLSISGIH